MTAAPAANDEKAPDFTATRPGDALRAFMRYDIPLELSEEISAAAEAANAQCSPDLNRTYPTIDALRVQQVEDPASFRDRHGYGVIVEVRRTPAGGAPPAPGPTLTGHLANVSDEALSDIVWECDIAVDKAIEQHLAPTEIHVRYNELFFEALESEEYRTASSAWRDCMTGHGHPTDQGPFDAQFLVEQAVDRAAANTDPASTDTEDDGHHHYEEVRIPDDVLDALHAYELEVFAADSTCLAESGAGVTMLAIEARLVEQLETMFPDYAGSAFAEHP